MAECEELKDLLMKVEKENKKVGLNLNIQKTLDHDIWSQNFRANRYETVEIVTDLILGGSKITADDDRSHEIKSFLLEWKVMTNLDSILKCIDITLPTKFGLDKAMVFPVVMYGCERWAIQKAERWRTDAVELWC